MGQPSPSKKSLSRRRAASAAAAFATAQSKRPKILPAVVASQLSAVSLLLASLPSFCSLLFSLRSSTASLMNNSPGGTFSLPLFSLCHSSLEFASSSPTTLKTLTHRDPSSSFPASSLSFPHASLASGTPATSSGATSTKTFPLDPQTKATTSKPRNHSSSGPCSSPLLSHSSGLTSFAFAEPTLTLLNLRSNSRRRDLSKLRKIRTDHSDSRSQKLRFQESEERWREWKEWTVK